eukprot:jgi/Undpi1/8278/HiC_scaffold_25.g10747.m1
MKRLAPILGALVALICGREGCAGDDAMSEQQTQQQQQQCPETGSCDINLEDTEAVGVDAAMDVAVGEVPVIDISALMSPDLRSKSDWDEAAAAVARACEQWGFFQAINHGIPEALLDRLVSKGRDMFALPRDEKAAFKRTETNARGWFDDELTKQTRDWKEGFDVGHVPAPDLPPDHPTNVVVEGYNQWPRTVPGFKETVDAFYSGATNISERLLEGVATHLGLPRGHFGPSFHPHTSYLRLNYYPPCPEPCGKLSVNRHSDAGALTVLLQENGSTALQVNHQGTGRWVSIPPVDGAVTINVGDMLQVWTNDLFRAPEHRVLSQTHRDRFSAPFFYNPAYHADVAPLPLPRATEAPLEKRQTEHEGADGRGAGRGLAGQGIARYRTLNWGDYRLQRFAGDYADKGVEVQISHFLVDGSQ